MNTRFNSKQRSSRSRYGLGDYLYRRDGDFKCAHCRHYVSAASILSGVNNRNHCPYCLWSRHLDLSTAGDRLAACKAPMQPVGLTLKRTRKKYGKVKGGELMLIHLCVECGKASINRIAADDDVETVLGIFEGSFAMDRHTKTRLAGGGIEALQAADRDIVQAQLLGHGIILDKDG